MKLLMTFIILLFFVTTGSAICQTDTGQFDKATLASFAKTWFAAYYSGMQAEIFISNLTDHNFNQSSPHVSVSYRNYLLVDTSDIHIDFSDSKYNLWRDQFIIVRLFFPGDLHWNPYLLAMDYNGVPYRLSGFSVSDFESLVDDRVFPINDSDDVLNIALFHAMVVANIYDDKTIIDESNINEYIDNNMFIYPPKVRPITTVEPWSHFFGESGKGYWVHFYTLEDQVDRWELVLNVYRILEDKMDSYQTIVMNEWSKSGD